jgi:hypothetical protein
MADLLGLDQLTAEGEIVSAENDPEAAQEAFHRWSRNVSAWLRLRFPDSGLASEWAAQPTANLVFGYHHAVDPVSFMMFRRAVSSRMAWLSSLPTKVRLTAPLLPQLSKAQIMSAPIQI